MDYAELCSTHACGDCYRCNLTRAQSALATAEALALANGEARERAEAEVAKLRVDMEEMVEAAGRHTALDARLDRLADGLTENGRAIDAAVVARAATRRMERLRAEGDELRGLLAGVTETCACSKCEAVRAWLLAHPAAIPEGTPAATKAGDE